MVNDFTARSTRGKETVTVEAVKNKLIQLFNSVYAHNGYGSIEIDMRILKRGQKEILLRCGKEYRFVVNCPEVSSNSGS